MKLLQNILVIVAVVGVIASAFFGLVGTPLKTNTVTTTTTVIQTTTQTQYVTITQQASYPYYCQIASWDSTTGQWSYTYFYSNTYLAQTENANGQPVVEVSCTST
jgi:hypothetical protein